jgi:hypothetical protein
MKFQPSYVCHAPAQYIYGQRPDDGHRTPEDLSSGEVAAAKMAHPEWSTKSAKILRCLAFLDTFAPRPFVAPRSVPEPDR